MYLNLFLGLVFQECLREGSCESWCVAYLRVMAKLGTAQHATLILDPNIMIFFWTQAQEFFILVMNIQLKCSPLRSHSFIVAMLHYCWIFEGGQTFALSAVQLWEFQGFPREDVSFLTCSPRSSEGYVVLWRLTSLSYCRMVIVYVREYHQNEQCSWFLRSTFKYCILQGASCKLKVF